MPDFLPSVRSALKEADAPLRTLDALAADLPEESHVKRLVFAHPGKAGCRPPAFFIIDMIYDRV
jgi:hypothetical protein